MAPIGKSTAGSVTALTHRIPPALQLDRGPPVGRLPIDVVMLSSQVQRHINRREVRRTSVDSQHTCVLGIRHDHLQMRAIHGLLRCML
jgi:hypothetical protein